MLLIVDGNNMAHRALHTVSLSHRGVDTSVTYGTLLMLSALLKKFRPASVAFCFDGGTPEFRKELLPEYKANREKDNPGTVDWDDFHRQVDELCYYALPIHGVMTLREKDVEADDLMAQAAYLSEEEVVIVTTDADLLQCVGEGASVYHPFRDETYTVDNLYSTTGIPQYFHLLYKMLCGDTSDGICGVQYVGEKTAKNVICWVIDNLDEVLDPYQYVTLCQVLEDLPLNSRQRRAFLDLGEEKWNAMYDVMDLMIDRCNARYTIQVTEWMPADTEKVRDYYFKNGFMSLLEERADRLYQHLVEPVFAF
jgi:5'-3' exonuclease